MRKEESLHEKLKEFHRMLIVIGILSSITFLTSHFIYTKTIQKLNIIEIIIYFGAYIYITNFDYNIRKNTLIALIFLSLTDFFGTLILYKIAMFIHIWKVIIVIIAFIFLSAKEAVFLTLFVVILGISAPFISDYYGLAIIKAKNQDLWFINQRLTIIYFILFTFTTIYYAIVIQKFKTKIEIQSILDGIYENTAAKNDEVIVNLYSDPSVLKEKEIELLEKIKIYFEEKKPYLDPNFSMQQLANAVDSNLNYVSKTLNLVDEKGFAGFVNRYRVSFVIEQLQNQAYKNYTLSYIYESAGFSQQSTFNRVFKHYLGQSPREYIKNFQNSIETTNNP
ncbi:helix-turn-helix domain-containing protein [Chryseobacterium limigenitum]|uniref:AraC-type DNA-binding protein n=1 Tax=Chryseobacterium limigenitum TaxID=1612149 RepID=A0A1K2IX72_9FLAO|nr:AraC family transcriptional regulator [Chryseobacterium limigenitum]SFZ97033.1 AraC-type DNA-binding protein [Chryseobacterium limigenitum]